MTNTLCLYALHCLVSLNAVHPVFVLCTPHTVSSFSCIGLSIEEFLWTPGFESMVENGSLCIMSALFQYIRAVGNCHGVPDRTGAMYGAFSSKLNPMCFSCGWLVKDYLSLYFCRAQRHSLLPYHSKIGRTRSVLTAFPAQICGGS